MSPAWRGYRNAVAPIRADIFLIGDSYVAAHTCRTMFSRSGALIESPLTQRLREVFPHGISGLDHRPDVDPEPIEIQ